MVTDSDRWNTPTRSNRLGHLHICLSETDIGRLLHARNILYYQLGGHTTTLKHLDTLHLIWRSSRIFPTSQYSRLTLLSN